MDFFSIIYISIIYLLENKECLSIYNNPFKKWIERLIKSRIVYY